VGRDHTLFALIDGYVKFGHATRERRKVSVYTEFPGRPSVAEILAAADTTGDAEVAQA